MLNLLRLFLGVLNQFLICENCFFIKGNMADPRMRSAAKRRGVEITSLSRPIKASDFREFDLILAMDEQNKGTKKRVR